MTELKLPRYTVWLNPGPGETEVTEHEVTVTHQDQLRGEQMGSRMGLPPLGEAPMTGTSLWCWASLKRTGVIDMKPGEFLNVRMAHLKSLNQAGDDVDPTQPDPDTGSV